MILYTIFIAIIIFDFNPVYCLNHNCGCKENKVQRLVNGQALIPNVYPWVVSMSYPSFRMKHFCGGTILNSEWILTAGHCLSDYEAQNIYVSLGSNMINDSNAIVIQGEQMYIHPEYRGLPDFRNDVGLLRLKTPIKFSPNIQPACLPGPEFTNYDQLLTAVGWGRTSSCSKISKYLMGDKV